MCIAFFLSGFFIGRRVTTSTGLGDLSSARLLMKLVMRKSGLFRSYVFKKTAGVGKAAPAVGIYLNENAGTKWDLTVIRGLEFLTDNEVEL